MQFPALSTPVGERAAYRLKHDRFTWLTTVDAKGMPQPTLVWFLWDVATTTVLIYSRSEAKRLVHLQQNPKAALHFDGDGQGADTIVITGTVRFSPDDPPADHMPLYLEKYRDLLSSPPTFAARYSVALRIHPTSIRGYLGTE